MKKLKINKVLMAQYFPELPDIVQDIQEMCQTAMLTHHFEMGLQISTPRKRITLAINFDNEPKLNKSYDLVKLVKDKVEHLIEVAENTTCGESCMKEADRMAAVFRECESIVNQAHDKIVRIIST